MQSRILNFFNPNFQFDRDNVFLTVNNDMGPIFPPTESLIITENNNPIVDENGNNLIIE